MSGECKYLICTVKMWAESGNDLKGEPLIMSSESLVIFKSLFPFQFWNNKLESPLVFDIKIADIALQFAKDTMMN